MVGYWYHDFQNEEEASAFHENVPLFNSKYKGCLVIKLLNGAIHSISCWKKPFNSYNIKSDDDTWLLYWTPPCVKISK